MNGTNSGAPTSSLTSEPIGILPDKDVFTDGEVDGFITDTSASDMDTDERYTFNVSVSACDCKSNPRTKLHS